jgi:two-component system nitrate/nitrite response regulator NarL
MLQSIATIVIEPRSLVREGLVSLLADQSYQVVGSVASISDIDHSLHVAVAPQLVILGALPLDEATVAAESIRRLWPKAKIILLFDHVSSGDFCKLLTSEIDGCVPLYASPDTLADTLHKIISGDLRILVLKIETSSSLICPAARQEANELIPTPNSPARSTAAGTGVTGCMSPLRIPCGLSQREEEILKDVVRGYSNKMIARACGVTDATIKVHMKSILRKIRVANRTQAAIWALEQGYGADKVSFAGVSSSAVRTDMTQ